jgi:hypothetical protein
MRPGALSSPGDNSRDTVACVAKVRIPKLSKKLGGEGGSGTDHFTES